MRVKIAMFNALLFGAAGALAVMSGTSMAQPGVCPDPKSENFYYYENGNKILDHVAYNAANRERFECMNRESARAKAVEDRRRQEEDDSRTANATVVDRVSSTVSSTRQTVEALSSGGVIGNRLREEFGAQPQAVSPQIKATDNLVRGTNSIAGGNPAARSLANASTKSAVGALSGANDALDAALSTLNDESPTGWSNSTLAPVNTFQPGSYYDPTKSAADRAMGGLQASETIVANRKAADAAARAQRDEEERAEQARQDRANANLRSATTLQNGSGGSSRTDTSRGPAIK